LEKNFQGKKTGFDWGNLDEEGTMRSSPITLREESVIEPS